LHSSENSANVSFLLKNLLCALNISRRSRTSSSAPPGCPPSTFSRWWCALLDLQLQHLPRARRRCFHVGGGRSWTFSSSTSLGPAVYVFTLLVGALGPSAPTPLRGPLLTFSRCYWTILDLQLFTLVVGAPRPSAPAPPGGPSSMFRR
jgi:hypothetical protein